MRHSYHLPSYKKYMGARTTAYRFSVCPWHYYSTDRHNLSSCTNSSFPLDKSQKSSIIEIERAYQQTVCSHKYLLWKIAALCGSGAVIFIYSGKTCLTRHHSGAIIKAYGALAQLGVRHIRIVKVRGSILLCSTRNPPKFQENYGGLFYTISYIKTCDA